MRGKTFDIDLILSLNTIKIKLENKIHLVRHQKAHNAPHLFRPAKSVKRDQFSTAAQTRDVSQCAISQN